MKVDGLCALPRAESSFLSNLPSMGDDTAGLPVAHSGLPSCTFQLLIGGGHGGGDSHL